MTTKLGNAVTHNENDQTPTRSAERLKLSRDTVRLMSVNIGLKAGERTTTLTR